MPAAQGQVGPQVLADGAQPVQGFRQARTGELIVSELQGRYYEQASRGRLFAAYCAAQATSLVGTAMVGLQLWNGGPVSGPGAVNLVVQKAAGMVIATSANTTALVLATGVGQTSAPSGQTAATRVSNCLIGGPAPVATALAAGTFTNAPTALWPLMHNTAAIATTGEDQGFQMDFEGSIIIPPQCYVCIAAVGGAVAASGSNLGIIWAEVTA